MYQDPTQSQGPFGLDYANDETIIVSQRSMRIVIGILGMGLPLLLMLFLWIDVSWGSPLHSISHYYYTRASAVFVIVVSLLAIFLLVYKGKEAPDFWLSFLAGSFALCVLLFPTDNISKILPDQDNPFSVTILRDSPFRVGFHYISAGIFLLSLACMSFFLFTRSSKPVAQRGRAKRRRNRVYRACGVIMFLAVAVVFCGGFLGWIPSDTYDKNNLTFWMEAVAVEAFGFSWLVKAEVLLKDKPALQA